MKLFTKKSINFNKTFINKTYNFSDLYFSQKNFYCPKVAENKFTSVILVENLVGVGEIGEILNVSKGYARNHLFPKLMAVYDTPENRDKFEPYTKLIDYEAREKRRVLEKNKKRLDKLTVKFKRHVISPGVTHGRITVYSILAKLKKQYNIVLTTDNILLPEPIVNTLGLVEVPVRITLDDGQLLESKLKLDIKKR
eukprot:TRINITY_DN363_c0_g1_i1.p1 TRINITY_DN363_c0_g1~~TRINITY_DN363_c0_g1_i1.p1  ORF type:complete len:196 (+),score=58.61 TRINITY_DN363_c0_g1_i1:31-618(+)